MVARTTGESQAGPIRVTLDAAIGWLSRRRSLDRPAGCLAGLTSRRHGRVIEFARGRPLGHPAHPALTDLPIGFWTSAFVLDLVGGRHAAPVARALVGWGVVSALPTIATGLADVPGLPDSKRRVAVVHAGANLLATGGFGASWVLRRRSQQSAGVVVGAVAGAVASIGGALGGWMALSHDRGSAPEDLAATVAARLNGRHLATAESCTAGRLATALATAENAVEFYRGTLVAYQPEVKRAELGVAADSVFSTEAARQMALGTCAFFETEAAVATTGVVGDSPQDGVPPGTVFIATAVDGRVSAIRYLYAGSPTDVCDQATAQALRDLAEALGAA